VPKMVLRDVASWCQLYLATKPSHVRVDVDGPSYPLHYPTACSHQSRGHGFLSGAGLFHRAIVDGGAFSGNVRPPVLDI
jgi:hypothetical protein